MQARNTFLHHKSAQKALEDMAQRLDVTIPRGFVTQYIESVENVTILTFRYIMNSVQAGK